MKVHEFKTNFDRVIMDHIITTTNQLMGLGRTNFLAIGLFLQLPIKLVLEQSDEVEKDKQLSVDQLNELFMSTVTDSNIVFTILYKDEKHLKHIWRVSEKYPIYFAYHFMKQLQHVLKQHHTDTYQASMFRIVHNRAHPFELIDMAANMSANATVRALIQLLGYEAKKQWDTISHLIPTHSNNLDTDLDILLHLKANDDKIKVSKIKNSTYVRVEHCDLTYITQPKNLIQADQTYTPQSSDKDTNLASIATQIGNSINSATKGIGGVSDIFKQLLDAVKTDVSWFKKLTRSFHTQVDRITDESYTSWNGLNNTYRNIYASPKHNHIERKVKVIVSIDNSTSVHTEDLQKIFYLFKKKSKQIAEVRVLIHTDAVTQEFTISHYDDIAKHPDFITAFGCRNATGCTSHKDVFEKIKQMNLINPEEWLYFCFSDMYSDIETFIGKYPIINRMTPYWIAPANGSRELNTKIVGGTFIWMP